MKRFYFSIIALLLCMSLSAQSGKCGPNLTWSFDKATGTLTIAGSGTMYDYGAYIKDGHYHHMVDAPWENIRQKINHIVLSEGLTTIGKSAFWGIDNLESVVIPNSVVKIGASAFGSNDKLSSLTLGEGVVIIDAFAFANCKSLTSVSGAKNLAYIEYCAFEGCNALKSVSFPGLVEIRKDAFKGCSSLREFKYPKGLDFRGASIPMGAKKMAIPIAKNPNKCGPYLTWSFDRKTSTLTISGSGAMYNYDYDKTPWYDIRYQIYNVSISEGVTVIGEWAFNSFNVASYVIPNSVVIIRGLAFSGNKKLSTVSFGDGLVEIGGYAFDQCPSLHSLTFGKNLTKIGNRAFWGCSGLKSIVLPPGPIELEKDVFADTQLEEVHYPEGSKNISRDDFPPSAKLIAYSTNTAPTRNTAQSTPKTSTPTPKSTYSTPKVTSALPNLTVVDGSVTFADNTKNNTIDAIENCAIRFKVQNIGKGAAKNCVATVRMSGHSNGITVKNVPISVIAPETTVDVEIPISTNNYTATGQVTFTVEVTEPNGFGADPFELSVNTRAFEQPYLQIVDYAVTGAAGGTLVKKQPFNLQLMLQNTKYGQADNVVVELVLPANVFLLDGDEKSSIKTLEGGKAKSLDYQLVVNNNYSGTVIPIQVKIKEKYGKYAEDKSLNLELNQNLASSRLTVKAAEAELIKQEIQLASIGSAVDKNIPLSKEHNENTFAVIIANENYQRVAKVPYALNDGTVFKQYCEKTLGIPAHNIHFVADGTLNDIRSEVNWLSKIISAYNGNARIIFYYAGHGVPDEQSRTAFLLPKDGNGSDISTGYKLDDLYAALGALPTQSVTVFLDACFSGSKREEGMLVSARGVAIKAKSGEPQGNMVVFSAAQGDETAYPNNDEQHGIFTYYLLKKLQETKGDVTLQDLGNYITTNVRQQSIVKNGKPQTPCVTPSASLGTSWQTWTLK